MRSADPEHDQAIRWVEAEQVRYDRKDAVGRANLDLATAANERRRTILTRTILGCTILGCTILRRPVLRCTVLGCTVQRDGSGQLGAARRSARRTAWTDVAGFAGSAGAAGWLRAPGSVGTAVRPGLAAFVACGFFASRVYFAKVG
ncbi:MAG TPA: hypothetical protein VFQ44_18930 [Streptosporangiaceae bacterium]|nr:hypothetical protein [Streptosporangiaceae bacterium]